MKVKNYRDKYKNEEVERILSLESLDLDVFKKCKHKWEKEWQINDCEECGNYKFKYCDICGEIKRKLW